MFETRAKVLRTIEKKIERRLQKVLGFNVPVFIRTHAELKQIVAFEPFENSEVHGADVNLILLAENLDESSELMALRTGTDGFLVHGREIYSWRRKKPSTSLFSTVPLRQPWEIRNGV